MALKKTKKNKQAIENKTYPISGSNKKILGFGVLKSFGLQAVLLAFICIVFYANTFSNGYAVDDFLVIDKNEAVMAGVKGIPQLLTSDVFDSYYRRNNASNRLGGGRYRPLSIITFAVEHQIFAKTYKNNSVDSFTADTRLAHIRHFNNVLLYILSVILLLYFFHNIVFPFAPILAFISVLLFTIHPLHTEVVANIKSRDEILSFLFIILTLLIASFYHKTTNKWHLLLALSFFFMALLSKEYAVSVLVIVPLIQYVFNKQALLNSCKSALPFLVVFLFYVLVRYSVVPFKGNLPDDDLLNNPYLLANGTQEIATKITALLLYVKLLFYPYPLSVDYSFNQLPYVDLIDVSFWLSLLFHIGALFGLVYLTLKRHVMAFAFAFYLVHLLLVSNLIFNIGATIGERLIYHSSLGFCMVITMVLYWAYQKIPAKNIANLSITTMVLILVVLSGMVTHGRNKDWESNSTLYRKDVLAAPNSAITNGNAGNAYLQLAALQDTELARKEHLNQALIYLNKAISIYSGYTLAYINRGNVFFQLGDLQKAKQDWDTAKQQYPTNPYLPGLFASYYINSSVKLGSEGKFTEAIVELNKGAALEPQNTTILFNLGYYYNRVGKNDSAIYAFQKIITINPSDTLASTCASYIEILKRANR